MVSIRDNIFFIFLHLYMYTHGFIDKCICCLDMCVVVWVLRGFILDSFSSLGIIVCLVVILWSQWVYFLTCMRRFFFLSVYFSFPGRFFSTVVYSIQDISGFIFPISAFFFPWIRLELLCYCEAKFLHISHYFLIYFWIWYCVMWCSLLAVPPELLTS